MKNQILVGSIVFFGCLGLCSCRNVPRSDLSQDTSRGYGYVSPASYSGESFSPPRISCGVTPPEHWMLPPPVAYPAVYHQSQTQMQPQPQMIPSYQLQPTSLGPSSAPSNPLVPNGANGVPVVPPHQVPQNNPYPNFELTPPGAGLNGASQNTYTEAVLKSSKLSAESLATQGVSSHTKCSAQLATVYRGQSPDENEEETAEKTSENIRPRTDFNTRKQETLSIQPELKEIGSQMPYHPQVFSENINPGPWSPGNQPGPWPQDEYLADGGDDHQKVLVMQNWELRGLNPEDTIVHYETLNHETKVDASNRVHLYSPRFGTIRKVTGLVGNQQWIGFATVDHAAGVDLEQGRQKIGQAAQKLASGYTRDRKILHGTSAGANLGEIETKRGLVSIKQKDHLRSYTALLSQRTFTASQLVYLAEGQKAAAAWDSIDSVSMIVNNNVPMTVAGSRKPQEVLVIGDGETTPQLKLFKVASTDAAKQGEIVEFYIRFDNTGSELVGNVTIVDSLTPRLEYISGSAGSSIPAEFFTEPNEAGSQTLRWEITKPLKAGDFGVLRFRCRVQ